MSYSTVEVEESKTSGTPTAVAAATAVVDPYTIVRGSRIRVKKFLAEVVSESGATLRNHGLTGSDTGAEETFTGVVLGVYGNHPTSPTLIEVKVRRDDTGAEIYCNTATVVEVFPRFDPLVLLTPKRGNPDPWFQRKLQEAVDRAVDWAPTIDVEDDRVPELTEQPEHNDEVEIEV